MDKQIIQLNIFLQIYIMNTDTEHSQNINNKMPKRSTNSTTCTPLRLDKSQIGRALGQTNEYLNYYFHTLFDEIPNNIIIKFNGMCRTVQADTKTKNIFARYIFAPEYIKYNDYIYYVTDYICIRAELEPLVHFEQNGIVHISRKDGAYMVDKFEFENTEDISP